jgi:hypothetical protein
MSDIRNTDAERGTHTTTIIERRGGGGTLLLAIVLLAAVIVGAWYLFTMAPQQSAKDKAIAGAATSVGHAADKVGDAVDQGSK